MEGNGLDRGTAITPIERAAINWLIAHDAFRYSGSECLQLYVDADEALLEEFCIGWKNADPKHLRLAYLHFQDSLLQQQEPEPILIPLNINDLPLS